MLPVDVVDFAEEGVVVETFVAELGLAATCVVDEIGAMELEVTAVEARGGSSVGCDVGVG